jgi:O-antigen/teichoic acid export membrane protein
MVKAESVELERAGSPSATPMMSAFARSAVARVRRYLPAFACKWLERIETSPIGRRFARGAFWSVAGNVLSRALSLLATMIVARMLGKALYGRVGIIQSTVDMFGALAGLGLSFTATKHVAEFRRSNPERAGQIVAMVSVVSWISGGVITLGLVIIAPWLAANTLQAPEMTGMLRIGALLLFFSTVNAAQIGTLSGLEAFDVRAKMNVISAVLNLPLMIAGLLLGGTTGVIVALVVGSACLCALNARALRREARRAGIPLILSGWSREAKMILNFSLPTMAASLINPPANWACNTMLVRSPGGFAALGVYSAANQWFNAIVFLPTILSVVSMPVLSQLIGQKKWEDVGKITWISVRANGLVLFPVLALSIASHWIMRLYGPGFTVGSSTLVLNLGTGLLVALFSPIWPMLIAAGKTIPVLVMNVAWAVTFTSLTYFLVHFGSVGLAGARFAAYLLHTGWMSYYAWRFLRHKIRLVPVSTA